MEEFTSSKIMTKKRLSISDNAKKKSVMNTGIDVTTGRKTEENVTVKINDVVSKNINEKTIAEARRYIAQSVNENDIYYKNLREPSFEGCQVKELEKGFNIVKKSLSQSKQRDKIWIDLTVILNEYAPKDNFDAYILGVYYGLRAYTKEHLLALDKLFNLLKENNITEYDTFTKYCKNLELVKEDIIDEDRYQKKLNDMLFNTKLLED